MEKIVDKYFALVPRVKPSKKEALNAQIIAHRGAYNNKKGIIENTHKAFQYALELGCWGIELDIQTTKDKVLVVNHDPTLERLWGHRKRISELNYSELRDLVPEIPTLEEVVLEYGKKMHLFIELKFPFHHEKELVDTLKPLAPCTHYHLLSLDSSIFPSLSSFPKEALLLVALHNNVRKLCDLSLSVPYGGVLGSYVLLTNKKLRRLKEANQVSGVGFVNSKNSLYRELNRGISWLFTNQARDVCQFIKELQ